MRIKYTCSETYDINYLCRIVQIDSTRPIPGADRLRLADVFGFQVIVGIDCEPGKYLYFPVGSQISSSLLSFLNLYRDRKRNMDKSVSNDNFEGSGRVRMIKLRGEISEGYLIKYSDFIRWIEFISHSKTLIIDDLIKEFDQLVYKDDEEQLHQVWVCRKYLESKVEIKRPRHRGKIPERLRNIITDDQFRFHYETEQLNYCLRQIKPQTWIWITKKVDGTSGISSRVLVGPKNKRNYRNIYASSSVIRNKDLNINAGLGWYGVDVWKEADKVVGPLLDSGETAYYEIIGYLPIGGNAEFIQKNNDFGCIKPKDETEYKVGRNFRVLIYRVTYTTPEGNVHELNPTQVQEWSKKKGLESVQILYCGYAKDLYPDLDITTHWSKNFLDRLKKDKNFGMEELDPECKNEVPVEGLVIRAGNKAYKLKTDRHLIQKQIWQEKGYIDPEDLCNG